MLKLKWLIYTVLVGLIPIFARLMVYALSPRADAEFMWSETDISAFGLVLNITNINALEHETVDPTWKTICNGLSLLHIVFIGGLFILSFTTELQRDLIASDRLIQASVVLSFTSLVLSFAVYDRLSRILK